MLTLIMSPLMVLLGKQLECQSHMRGQVESNHTLDEYQTQIFFNVTWVILACKLVRGLC